MNDQVLNIEQLINDCSAGIAAQIDKALMRTELVAVYKNFQVAQNTEEFLAGYRQAVGKAATSLAVADEFMACVVVAFEKSQDFLRSNPDFFEGIPDRFHDELSALIGEPAARLYRRSLLSGLAAFFHAVASVFDWLADVTTKIDNFLNSPWPNIDDYLKSVGS